MYWEILPWFHLEIKTSIRTQKGLKLRKRYDSWSKRNNVPAPFSQECPVEYDFPSTAEEASYWRGTRTPSGHHIWPTWWRQWCRERWDTGEKFEQLEVGEVEWKRKRTEIVNNNPVQPLEKCLDRKPSFVNETSYNTQSHRQILEQDGHAYLLLSLSPIVLRFWLDKTTSSWPRCKGYAHQHWCISLWSIPWVARVIR